MERTHLKALQRVVCRGRGKDQKAVRVRFAQLLCRVHAAHPVNVNIQKGRGKALLFFCGEKALAAFKFQNLRLCAAQVQLPRKARFQLCALGLKIIHNCYSHAGLTPFRKVSI